MDKRQISNPINPNRKDIIRKIRERKGQYPQPSAKDIQDWIKIGREKNWH